jgi:hypothetical protein
MKTRMGGVCLFCNSISRCEVVRHARVGERAVEFEVNEEFIVVVHFYFCLTYIL